jgi:cyclopropane fatty-acyl-phospholipid synthase-like methyltransferase
MWNDPHISKQMLKYHLDPSVNLASRTTDFIERSVAWITSRFHLGENSSLCDFGCGPGLYTNRFAKQHIDVVGIDLSRRSIQHAKTTAKNEGLPVRYILGNYLEVSPKAKFDLLTMIFCDFCVLNPKQRATLLKKFSSLLKEDGYLLLDVCSKAFFHTNSEGVTLEHCPSGGFWTSRPYFVFDATFTYEKDLVVLKKATIVERKKNWEIFNWLQCYTLSALQQEFQAAGLQIVEHYANVAGDPYTDASKEMTVVARKRK